MGVRLFLLIGMLLLGGGCKLMDIVDEGQSSERLDLHLTKQSLLLDHAGGYLYVSVGNLGLDIIDISNEKAPRVIKNYRTEDRTYAITRSGERLFLANGTGGVELLDISDPRIPRRIAYIRTDENATAVATSADARRLAVGTAEGVRLYDLDRIDQPRYLGRFDTNGTVYDLQFSPDGTRLYLANFSYGIELLDLSSVSRIARLDALPLEGSACDIAADFTRQRLYVASLTSALKTIDIADRDKLEILQRYDAHDGSQIWESTGGVQFDRLYLAKGEAGIEIVENTRSADPVPLGSYDTNGTARGIAVNAAETRAYVADGEAGLKIVDISDKKRPERIGTVKF